MEFRPAHTAWQDVQTKGFRTFLKYHGHVSELFVNARDKQMLLGANSLTLQCRETDAPVRAQVQYFILPNACVGALARTLTIEILATAYWIWRYWMDFRQLFPMGSETGI